MDKASGTPELVVATVSDKRAQGAEEVFCTLEQVVGLVS